MKPTKPQQMSFAFMKSPQTERKATLSKEEQVQLIQTLANFMMSYLDAEVLTDRKDKKNEF